MPQVRPNSSQPSIARPVTCGIHFAGEKPSLLTGSASVYDSVGTAWKRQSKARTTSLPIPSHFWVNREQSPMVLGGAGMLIIFPWTREQWNAGWARLSGLPELCTSQVHLFTWEGSTLFLPTIFSVCKTGPLGPPGCSCHSHSQGVSN